MDVIRKYPRTPHLAGSALQPGDEDLRQVPFAEIAGLHVIVEEKLDGANCGISFDDGGRLYLQSRGHFLSGGPRERQFDLLKAWARHHEPELRNRLGNRFILYGEWLYARHTIYYDELPHYLIEFDIFDRRGDEFLSTSRRRELLAGLAIVSAPVLFEGVLPSAAAFAALSGRTNFRSPVWQDRLAEAARAEGLDPARVLAEADPSPLMEGLYIKAEDAQRVLARFKYIRPGFRQVVDAAEGHWQTRPLLANRLAAGVDLFLTG